MQDNPNPQIEDEEISPLDQQKAWYDQYSTMPYKALAARMLELREAKAQVEAESTLIGKELEVINLRVVPERFLKDEISSLNIPGVGRLGLTKDAYCTQPADKREDLLAWLRENEFGDLIKDTVNPSSLKSLVKDLEKDDAEQEVEFSVVEESDEKKTPFEQICEFVNYTPFMRASVTKK